MTELDLQLPTPATKEEDPFSFFHQVRMHAVHQVSCLHSHIVHMWSDAY